MHLSQFFSRLIICNAAAWPVDNQLALSTQCHMRQCYRSDLLCLCHMNVIDLDILLFPGIAWA